MLQSIDVGSTTGFIVKMMWGRQFEYRVFLMLDEVRCLKTLVKLLVLSR